LLQQIHTFIKGSQLPQAAAHQCSALGSQHSFYKHRTALMAVTCGDALKLVAAVVLPVSFGGWRVRSIQV